MKEAIGTSLVFSLMMVFISVMIAILIGSISYSKGFKVRNRIIDRIEEYKGFSTTGDVALKIEEDLKNVGYRIVEDVDCADMEYNGGTVSSLTNNNFNYYNYCVYEYKTDRGNYYGVTVFIQFDIPLIGNYIKLPVYGETRIMYDKNEVEN